MEQFIRGLLTGWQSWGSSVRGNNARQKWLVSYAKPVACGRSHLTAKCELCEDACRGCMKEYDLGGINSCVELLSLFLYFYGMFHSHFNSCSVVFLVLLLSIVAYVAR